MKISEIIFPWWTIGLLKEKNRTLLDNLRGAQWSRTIQENAALTAFRAAAGANKGAKRLHDKHEKLKKENAALKAIIRTLKHKLGEE